jgi:hypothetical protein
VVERRAVSAVAVAVSLAVAATAVLLLAAPSPPNATNAAIDAAHRPGTHEPGTSPLITEDKPLGVGAAVPLLRPDMFSLRAGDLQMRGTRERRVLRFAGRLANAGPGPMVLRPRPRLHCPPGQRHARQLVHVDRNRDGRFQRRVDTAVRSRPAGCMVDHPTHGHWHFDAMASYRLIDPAPRRRVVAARAKVSFCLRDNRPIPGTQPRQRRAFFGECGRNLVQGISPGWFDLYDVETPGQSLRIPRRTRNGVYCLVLRADPRDQLVETDEGNNVRARAVRIRGMRVTPGQPRACRGVVR